MSPKPQMSVFDIIYEYRTNPEREKIIKFNIYLSAKKLFIKMTLKLVLFLKAYWTNLHKYSLKKKMQRRIQTNGYVKDLKSSIFRKLRCSELCWGNDKNPQIRI